VPEPARHPGREDHRRLTDRGQDYDVTVVTRATGTKVDFILTSRPR
jgi:hypothetical protein